MAVGGPNKRKDYHINEGVEFFYQIEGDMIPRVMKKTGPLDLSIKEGDIFLLPPLVPHSPQRPDQSIGIVIERKRRKGEKDGFAWYCSHCHYPLYSEKIVLNNIETDLPKVFKRFNENKAYHTCKKCGSIDQKKDLS